MTWLASGVVPPPLTAPLVVRRVVCPTCAAPRRVRCYDELGRETSRVHRRRVTRAQQRAESREARTRPPPPPPPGAGDLLAPPERRFALVLQGLKTDDLRRIVLAGPCPTCGASLGHPCENLAYRLLGARPKRRADGRRRHTRPARYWHFVHAARRRAAQSAHPKPPRKP